MSVYRRSLQPLALAMGLGWMLLVQGGQLLSAEENVKLMPLKYNNPGLEVDLGVGLWAYPLPMDYDGDGDLDLLVGCPDKPSNGTFYFENTSQDPSVKMPVFEAPVRLGRAFHNMLASEVNGESRVLIPGKYFAQDPSTGKFDFDKPTGISAPAKPLAIPGAKIRGNMWRYVDYDGDGDHDLIAGVGDWSDLVWDHAYDEKGDWHNGPLHGYVFLMSNAGDDAKPDYKKPEMIFAGDQPIDVFGWPCASLVDFDGDDDLDMIVGNFLDYFTYFENVGTREKPRYQTGKELQNVDGERLTMHLQMITPTAIDWDRDGDADLIVGDEDGRVAFIENTGELRDGQPVFENPVYFRQKADTLKFGALATPYVSDWDQDGDDDIICGNTAGNIGWFENLGEGEGGLPKWAEPVLLNVRGEDGAEEPFRILAGENGSIQGPCEAKWGYTTLSLADWDGDGDDDIIYNSILSEVGVLLNESGILVEQDLESAPVESPPAWYPWKPATKRSLTQWRTTPVALDFDGDEELDLVLMDQEGYLTLRRSAGEAERLFVDESGRPIRLAVGTAGRSGRVKIAVADWDSDGRLDVLINSENVTWYRNVADQDGKVVLKRVGNLARRNVAGHTASPAVSDFNRDGKWDLIVGSENGRIYHIFHDDCISFSGAEVAGDVQFEKALPAQSVDPKVDREDAISFDSTRGRIAAWIESNKEEAKSDLVRYRYHDGIKWSGPMTVLWDQPDSGKVECTKLRFDPSSEDGRIVLKFDAQVGDATQTVSKISYDRGRSFRDSK
ncbi:Cell surface protein [Rhodopirellula islandica]|uniref:Cell surface protein n=1 Tax=Rhodopirellula islandica TaxID=595434 RepID=A0A0J1B9I6_RHOIS|nr:VCBS repeat-containing protein [Rhodopirellula islandica]KLU03405.1 Cell surface protein [Rhodopirellula islandica]